MQAVCLQHVSFEGPAVFGRLLARRRIPLQPWLVPVDGLPESAGDLLLVMGGPMSVNDSDAWLAAETDFIGNAIRAGKPVIGICLGSQLMAKALGAVVGSGLEPEIGMIPISPTAGGRQDPVFGQLRDGLEVFAWHGEVFDLPPDAVALASSTLCATQAFRVGSKAYGLLFHLEIERAGVEALCRECPGDLSRAGLSAETVLSNSAPLLPRLHLVAELLLDHVLGLAR